MIECYNNLCTKEAPSQGNYCPGCQGKEDQKNQTSGKPMNYKDNSIGPNRPKDILEPVDVLEDDLLIEDELTEITDSDFLDDAAEAEEDLAEAIEDGDFEEVELS